MKKILVTLMLALLTVGLAYAMADEASPEYFSGDYHYILHSDGTAEITRFTGKPNQLAVPTELDGHCVVGIGNEAFYLCDTVTSITLPDGVMYIGDNAFASCFSLTSIVLPHSITSIGNHAFDLCVALTNVTLPDSVTSIGQNPFAACISLSHINVSPDHPLLTTIDGVLFNKVDKSLICYPYAFNSTSYAIPHGICAIEEYAFYGSESLRSISLPDSVTNLENNPFMGCANLTEIIVSPNHPVLTTIDGVLFNKVEKTLIWYPCASADESYTVPQGTYAIGNGAFVGCAAITNITLPAGLTAIGDYAFNGCYSLTNVTLPDSVTSVGVGAFSSCSSLASISLPNSLISIGDYAFNFCDALTTITLPDSVTSVGANPFNSCKMLTQIIVSSNHPVLTTIDGVLISKNEKTLICCPPALQHEIYVIPDGIIRIGDYAFNGCSTLISITLPGSLTSIGNSAFESCSSLTNLMLPNNVTYIGDSAFSGCSSLTNVILPDGITSIGNSAFYWCTSLTSITLPTGVTSIGDGAFMFCFPLKNINLPATVMRIGENAFEMCDSLYSLRVVKDSFAEEWALANGFSCTYVD